ncbi:MAG: hypothetical protein IBX64_10905 [Actinobacteria bacterium]|nr:hypothetical protein [Actinomycetota bacterium]
MGYTGIASNFNYDGGMLTDLRNAFVLDAKNSPINTLGNILHQRWNNQDTTYAIP